MNVLLLSTYELGHQPFGLASPAAFLTDAGADVHCLDMAVDAFDETAIRAAELIAIYLPMHTATRLASMAMPRIRSINPSAHLCFYGLYAPLNAAYLRTELGGGTILGGEFEGGLVNLYNSLTTNGSGINVPQTDPIISLAKQDFRLPRRDGLAALSRYAYVDMGQNVHRVVGYTEASRGCKHLCRHCPVVPVYNGKFRIVPPGLVIDDIRQQVEGGAEHITFGDPDFFNGIGHAIPVVEALHEEFPELSYDATIKVEHLLKYAHHLETLVRTGCLFVTTAVEAVDDHVLSILDKGHSRDDFVEVIELARRANLTISPTFIPFLPWSSREGYLELLQLLVQQGMVDYVAPVQLTIRLLVPKGSKLLAVEDMQKHLGTFDAAALSYQWAHPDPAMDALHAQVSQAAEAGDAEGATRREIFVEIWRLAHAACGLNPPSLDLPVALDGSDHKPCLSEPWYCCAEPTAKQIAEF
ncbi:MAG: CUAEP/CCAEP-tail radical SAM protein [Alphaproteobacteria bacterium]|nr:CUAEP/CCAEP-tail radical SAM protein [Alphaproteobacteria bacterium]